jgi:hypothetical protein
LHLQRLVGRVHELRRHLPRRLREVELGARQVGLEARALRLRRVDFNQPLLAVGKRARLHIAQRVADAPQGNRLPDARLAQRELVRPQGRPHRRVGQEVVEVECPPLRTHAEGERRRFRRARLAQQRVDVPHALPIPLQPHFGAV